MTAEGTVTKTAIGDTFLVSVDKRPTLSDPGLTAVGMKHRGDPEKRSKLTTNEAVVTFDATSPTDEPYITAGVGGVLGSPDVVNTSKLVSVRGDT